MVKQTIHGSIDMNYTKKQIELIKELKPVDCEELFDQNLDESQDMISIGSLNYSPSDVLKNVDPIAYRCGVIDYMESLVGDCLTDEIDGEYYLLEDVEHHLRRV